MAKSNWSLCLVMEAALVALGAENGVATFFHNLSGDGTLGAHRVDGDHGTLEIEHFQELGDGGDFMGFLADEDLGEGDPRFTGPRADGVEMTAFSAAGSAEGFAVDGNLAAFHREAEALKMGGDAAGEGGGFEGLEDPRRGVGAGNAMGQFQPFSQPILALVAEFFHESGHLGQSS